MTALADMCTNRTCTAPARTLYCSRACQTAARNPNHAHHIRIALGADIKRLLAEQADRAGVDLVDYCTDLLTDEALA